MAFCTTTSLLIPRDLPDQGRAVAHAGKADALEVAPLVDEGPALGHGACTVDGPVLMKAAQLGVVLAAGAVGDEEAPVHQPLKHGSQPRLGKPVTAAGAFAGFLGRPVVAAVEEDTQGVLKSIQHRPAIRLAPVKRDLTTGRPVPIDLGHRQRREAGPSRLDVRARTEAGVRDGIARHFPVQEFPLKEMLGGHVSHL